MTKDEIINRIDTAISEMQALKNEVQNIPEENEEVPEELIFEDGQSFYYVTDHGHIVHAHYNDEIGFRIEKIATHRAFMSLKYAEEFQRKTQFIADLLHFKWLYDRDFKGEWNHDTRNYFVFYDYDSKKYFCDYTFVFERSAIYFSTEEIAQKCADWLNGRKEKNEQ